MRAKITIPNDSNSVMNIKNDYPYTEATKGY